MMISLVFLAALAAQVPPERANSTFTVSDPALEWSLWASEPLFCNPTTIDIDHRGRVWVCEAVNYRCTLFKKPLNRPEGDRILILEDSKGQGRADKVTVFAQAPYIQAPMGIAVAKDPSGPGWKVYVCQSPDILVFEDKDGDGKADGPPKKLLTGFRGVDHDHGVHGITIGPDGKFYFSVGDQGVKDLQSSDGKGRKWTTNNTDCQAGAIWRCDMDGTNLELIAHNFRNPYKPCVDSFGTIFVSDNDDDGNEQTRICYVMPGGNYGYWPRGRGESHWHEEQPGVVPKILRTGFGSPTGMCVYEGTLLPEKYRGRVLHTDAGPRQLRAYTMKPHGAGYECLREDIVTSTDNWFRPSDVCVAPDGSVFVADWYDPGVGGHGVGDLTKGRIYRLAPKGNKYVVPKVELENEEGLATALGSPCLAVESMAMALSSQKHRIERMEVYQKGLTDEKPWRQARAIWQLHAPSNSAKGSGGTAIALAFPTTMKSVREIRRDGATPTFEQLCKMMAKDSRFTALMLVQTGPEEHLFPSSSEDWKIFLEKEPNQLCRDVLLAMRAADPTKSRPAIAELIKRYDGHDRFYLAAIGIAVGSDPKRREIFHADFDKQFPEWNDKVADLVWELRPPVMMPKLVTMLGERKLPEQRRARIVDILATQDAKFGLELIRVLRDESSPIVRECILKNVEHLIASKWRELRRSPELTALIEELLAKETSRGLALIAEANRDDLTPRVVTLVQRGSVDAIKTLGALGNTDAVAALANLLQTPKNRPALNALVASRRGTQWLIENKTTIPPDLLGDAGRLLRNSPYRDLREKAFAAFPPPAKLDMAKLPEIAVLAKKRGNMERGKAVLAASVNNDAACLKCHTVNGAGGQIGPDLSAIGTKGSRENLIESILYPSKAIADQFVNWQVTTKKGVALGGLIVEETNEAIVIRDANGKDTKIAKNEIESREKSPNSLMPDDNAKTLTEEELLDLVEYLMTLKKGA
jgi:putative membrane-bound dehydrogenase-like protein